MKNKSLAILIGLLLLAGIVGPFIPQNLAHAQIDQDCWSPSGQKVSDGNGPSTQDETGQAPAGHCNSWVNIDSVSQSGNTLTVNGTILGGDILSNGTCQIYVDQALFYSEVDDTRIAGTYDGQGNQISNPSLSYGTLPEQGQECAETPIDQQPGFSGQQEYATFSYSFSLNGYNNNQQYTTYIHVAPSFNGYYYDNPGASLPGNKVQYQDDYTQYTAAQCQSMGWSTTEDCRDYWSYYRFTPTGLTSTTGTMTVNADRNTTWSISGPVSENDSGTNKVYNGVPGGNKYTFNQTTNDAYGFRVTNGPTISLENPPSLLSYIVHSASAAGSICPDASVYECFLVPGGTIGWELTSTKCPVNISATVDGQNTSISGLDYTVTGPLENQLYSSAPQSTQFIADSGGGDATVQTSFPSMVTVNGQPVDLDSTHSVPSDTCNINGKTANLVGAYLSRATLNVQ